MPLRTFGLIAAATLAALVSAAPAAAGQSCFVTSNFQNWKAADESTIFIRTGVRTFYRLDLANRCTALGGFDPVLITRWRGTGFVCGPLDWDLRVSRGSGSPGEGCIVKAMTRLTAEEASAIPRKFKP